MPDAFDFKLAETLARAADHTYGKRNQEPELKWRVMTPFNRSTSHAMVFEFDDKIVLAFRGTDRKISDWVKNFVVELVDCRISDGPTAPGKVHRGFRTDLSALWKDVLAFIRPKATGPAALPLHVTGHSQGGAVAVIATALLVAEGIRPKATYTFAAPRPGNAAFADSLSDLTIHRVEHGDDIVPHVPPRISDNLRTAIKLLLIASPEELRALVAAADPTYASVGTLAYAPRGHFAMPSQTHDMYEARLMKLFVAGEHLVTDHEPTRYIGAVDML